MNRAQYAAVINQLGVPAEFKQALPPNVSVRIAKVGIATIRPRSAGGDDVVNSFAVGTRVVTILESSLPVRPGKFDLLTINGEKFVIEDVRPAEEPGSGVTIGYRCAIAGGGQ